MSELVVEPLELVNVRHDHGHTGTVAARALDLLENAQLKKAPVEDSGQAIEIGQLLHPLNIMCILDGGGANVSHGFQTLQFALSSASTPRICPNETNGMLMREADSTKNRMHSGLVARSFSMSVPLVERIYDQGSRSAGKRPPSGIRGVRVPWCARNTSSLSSRRNKETCGT